MAVGVRYYGRGTARPQGGYSNDPDFPGNQPGAINPRIAPLPTGPAAPKQTAINTIQLPGDVSYQVQSSPYGGMPVLYKEVDEILNTLLPTGPTLPGAGGIVPWPGLGGTGKKTMSDSDALALRKYEEEQARLKQGNLDAQAEYLRLLGLVPGQFKGLSDILAGQTTQSRTDIDQLFGTAKGELEKRRTRAEGLTGQGFEALANYLQRQPQQAMQRPIQTVPTQVTNTLAQYLSARGVPQEQVEAEVIKVNQAATDAQNNYGGLVNVLREQENNANASRIIEAQLAQSVANAQIQTLYGAGVSQLEQEKLKALATLNERVRQQQFELEQAKVARENALNEALGKLRESGFGIQEEPAGTPKTERTEQTTPTVSRAERVTTAGKDFNSFKEAVKALNPKQVAEYTKDGSGLSAKEIAELKKKNPKLAAQFK